MNGLWTPQSAVNANAAYAVLLTYLQWTLQFQIRMYYRLGTGIGVQQMLHVHSPGGSTFLCEMKSWTPSWKWSHIRNLIPSFSAYLLEEQSCQISYWSDLKQQSLGLFWRGHPSNRKKNTMSSDMRSVPELVIHANVILRYCHWSSVRLVQTIIWRNCAIFSVPFS